jgi:hypothetical protein
LPWSNWCCISRAFELAQKGPDRAVIASQARIGQGAETAKIQVGIMPVDAPQQTHKKADCSALQSAFSSSLGYCWLTQNTAVATANRIRTKIALASTVLSRLSGSVWSVMGYPFIVLMSGSLVQLSLGRALAQALMRR